MHNEELKNDSELGLRVHLYLKEMGVETPGVNCNTVQFTNGDKIRSISENVKSAMTFMGMDLSDDSLRDTPNRVAKMWVNELFCGMDIDAFPKCTMVDNKMKYDEMVLERNIAVMSVCEHHWATIDGIANIAYMPGSKVLGLSKLNRIVEYFARRGQIQERLTAQIYHALSLILETEDVAVVIDARHYCVKARGVRDQNSRTTTSKIGGMFRDGHVRAEFMSLAYAKPSV
jgi:GTP cyclohydrolase I